jgi:polygalacturonase
VNLHIEAGATLFASQDVKVFDRKIPNHSALLYGEDIENIAIEGRGTIDGQAEYDWREDDHEQGFSHKRLMLSLGKPLMRTFPKDFPKRTLYPFLVWLKRCKDVRITGLSLLHSPSWTLALYASERVVIDGIYAYTSLKEAVWADGIDLEGRARLRPGLIVDLVWPTGSSTTSRVRRARVWSWSVVRLGRNGPHYGGHCRWT